MAFINALYNLWPSGDDVIPGLRDGIAKSASIVFPKYGITGDLLVAHFMAQCSHECGAGLEVVENLNYSAERMMQVWPSRFPTLQDAEPFAHNPPLLANRVYNGRMGNAVGSNDGFTFRGRGATQTTGRDGYTLLAAKVGLPLLQNPDLVNNPLDFLECGVADFIICGCLPYARNDDIGGVTRRLNGGVIGLDQRTQWLVKWKRILSEDLEMASPFPDPPVVASQPKVRQNVFASLWSSIFRG